MNIIDKIVDLVGTIIVGLIICAIEFAIIMGAIYFISNIYYKIKNLKKDKNSKIIDYKTNEFKSNEEVANYIYNNARTKFNLLNDIIKQSDIIKKYAYENDYYTLMAYMDIFTCYIIRARKKYSEENMNQILTSYFKMVSDILTSSKYKISGNEMAKNYIEYILPTFKFSIKGKENPYLYMGQIFLCSVFDISITELETNYHDVIEQVADLFMSIYIDKDIKLK